MDPEPRAPSIPVFRQLGTSTQPRPNSPPGPYGNVDTFVPRNRVRPVVPSRTEQRERAPQLLEQSLGEIDQGVEDIS